MKNKIDRNRVIDSLAVDMRLTFDRKYSEKCKKYQRVTLYDSRFKYPQNICDKTIGVIEGWLKRHGYDDVDVWLRKTKTTDYRVSHSGIGFNRIGYVSLVFRFPYDRYFSNRGRK